MTIQAVEISDLSFKYPTSSDWVLRNVNLAVDTGEFLAITGPSGAGKTTLCTCLNGVIPNTITGDYYGKVNVFGKDPASSTVFEMAKTVGITFQEPEAQLFGLTVEEEVAFGPENYGFPHAELEERVVSSLELLRLKDLSMKSPYNLSGGQKQRVALASVLALRPKLLVMDEPFTELDPVGKAEISDAIERLREQYNVTIILVEHEAEEIARHADRVILLDKGHVGLDLKTKDFFNRIDVLHEHGVRSPQVTELFYSLKTRDRWGGIMPTTFDEGVALLTGKLNEGAEVLIVPRERQGPSAEGQDYLVFEGVSYTYPDGTQALSHISLSVKKGEYIGLVGQNGSGKTTLARIMVGLSRPTEGKLLVGGRDSQALTVADMSRHVGYLFQNPDHQIFCPTVFDEVAFGPRNLGLQEDVVNERVGSALTRVGLLDRKGTHPLFSSRGERQRIALASVLSMNPEVLILDEPTTGQDWNNNARILDLADDLNRGGTTIVLISHNMQFVAERTRRTIAMKDGAVLLDTTTANAFSQFDTLEQAFIRPPQITRLSAALHGAGVKGIALGVDEFADALAPHIPR